MKKYLSSYKLWDNPERLFELFWDNKKIAFIPNACDNSESNLWLQNELLKDMQELEVLWIVVEKLDLRDFFWKQGELETKLQEFGWVFVTWGNTFVLRQAYKLSWFDEILIDYEKNNPDFVYAWYSAWICILAPSLKWIEMCDDAECYPYDDIKETIWEGLGILDFSISPHFRSDHPESDMTEKEVQYYIDNKRLFKALRDGEVLIYD